VIGPNGAGKSTTFKVIMNLITFLGGEVVFDGTSLVGQRPDRILALGLGYVPQGRVVFSTMTVRENLEMGAYLQRDPAKVKTAMDYVFTLFPRLGERPRQLAGTMSGGEQQMLAMGRGLMMRPRMLMLDEPSLGLSPRFVDEVFDKTVAMARAGLTVMLVEQNAARAMATVLSKTSSTTRGLSPSEGSSSMSIRGRIMRPRPMASICCSPPLRVPASWRARSPSRGNSENTYSMAALTFVGSRSR
jgi:branched-chain amino acid transport system ATP-binding protein